LLVGPEHAVYDMEVRGRRRGRGGEVGGGGRRGDTLLPREGRDLPLLFTQRDDDFLSVIAKHQNPRPIKR
jgi:hypothetical protein